MNRRYLIALLGGAAVWPIAARAQADRVRRIGALMASAEDDPVSSARRAAFEQRLGELGWKIGSNLQIDYRWAGPDVNIMRAEAADLLKQAPEVIVVNSTPGLAVAQLATHSIPIVFTGVSDPVQQDFVTSLMRPGGNITGFTNYEFSIGGKWVDLLKQFSPALAHVAFIFNPDAAPYSKFFASSIEAAAPSSGVDVASIPIENEAGIESAISGISRRPNGGLIVATDVFLTLHRKQVVESAAHYRLPAVYAQRPFVEAGGLMRYGDLNTEQYRGAAVYVDRILKGTNPGELPIQLPTKFELVLNLTAARQLEREFPLGLLLRADEVIG